jgi:hypothetical protein
VIGNCAIEEQADIYAEMLDALAALKVYVIGVFGGVHLAIYCGREK